MGYKQPNNPMKMMKSALKMHKAEKKAGMHRDSAMYMNSPMYKGHSPMEMGHSPMEMGHSPMEMGHESPAEMGHSPMEMGHESPAKKYDSPMHKESRELKELLVAAEIGNIERMECIFKATEQWEMTNEWLTSGDIKKRTILHFAAIYGYMAM